MFNASLHVHFANKFVRDWLSLLINIFMNSVPQQSWVLSVETVGYSHSTDSMHLLESKMIKRGFTPSKQGTSAN